MTEIGQTWAAGVDCVREGSVTTWDGRTVAFKSLVQRRWGWPKKAAHAAARWLMEQARSRGEPAVLWVNNPWRRQQQADVFAGVPGIVDDLCSGLARGGSKEAEDADHEIVGVEVRFDRSITDDGLVRDVTNVLANRLGTTAESLREHTTYDTGGPVVVMRVRTSAFENEEP